MFYFFPFPAESRATANDGGASSAGVLPLLPAPRRSSAVSPVADCSNFVVDLLCQTLTAVASSMAAFGNQANALFAQLAAALSCARAANDTATLFDAAWFGFGAPNNRVSPFGPAWRSQQDPMAFSPFLTQSFANPWAAFAEGMNFWTAFLAPLPQRSASSFAGRTPAAPFKATVSGPGGMTWGFAWGL